MDPFVSTLEDEIQTEIEGNYTADEQIIISDEDIRKAIEGMHYPYFSYFYQNHSIKQMLQKFPKEFKPGFKNIFRRHSPHFNLVLKHSLANSLLTGVNCKEKPVPANLENILSSREIEVESIFDIEFFEMSELQRTFLDILSGITNDEINRRLISYSTKNPKANFQTFISVLNSIYKSKEEEFEDLISFFTKADTESLLEYMDDQKGNIIIKDDLFTCFLDTEKIHLQFARCNYGGKQANVLAYFGYGNYYPFSRIINGKNAANLRFMRLDMINGNNPDPKYFLGEIRKSDSQRTEELLEKFDTAQLTYSDYFNQHFSYSQRKEEFRSRFPEIKVQEDLDKIFMLNPQYRSKAAALSAYLLFEKNGISDLNKAVQID